MQELQIFLKQQLAKIEHFKEGNEKLQILRITNNGTSIKYMYINKLVQYLGIIEVLSGVELSLVNQSKIAEFMMN